MNSLGRAKVRWAGTSPNGTNLSPRLPKIVPEGVHEGILMVNQQDGLPSARADALPERLLHRKPERETDGRSQERREGWTHPGIRMLDS